MQKRKETNPKWGKQKKLNSREVTITRQVLPSIFIRCKRNSSLPSTSTLKVTHSWFFKRLCCLLFVILFHIISAFYINIINVEFIFLLVLAFFSFLFRSSGCEEGEKRRKKIASSMHQCCIFFFLPDVVTCTHNDFSKKNKNKIIIKKGNVAKLIEWLCCELCAHLASFVNCQENEWKRRKTKYEYARQPNAWELTNRWNYFSFILGQKEKKIHNHHPPFHANEFYFFESGCEFPCKVSFFQNKFFFFIRIKVIGFIQKKKKYVFIRLFQLLTDHL